MNPPRTRLKKRRSGCLHLYFRHGRLTRLGGAETLGREVGRGEFSFVLFSMQINPLAYVRTCFVALGFWYMSRADSLRLGGNSELVSVAIIYR